MKQKPFSVVAGLILLVSPFSGALAKSIGNGVQFKLSEQSCVLEVSEAGKRSFRPFCSASLIGAKTLVTAAHCKSDQLDDKKHVFQARCGALSQNKDNGEVAAFKETHTFKLSDIDANPQFKLEDTKSGNDIAYIKLPQASALKHALPVSPKSPLFEEIAKNPKSYECRVEGFGVSLTHLARLASAEDQALADALAKLLGEEAPVELPVGTSYQVVLDRTDGENANKGLALSLVGTFEVDYDEMKKADPVRYAAIIDLKKSILGEVASIQTSKRPESEKQQLLAELFRNVYPVMLLIADHKKELYGQSLWGDSGGGKLCRHLATGDTFLVAVTSRINIDTEQPESETDGSENKSATQLSSEASEAPAGKEKISYGTKFSPLTYNPGIFNEQASMGIPKALSTGGSSGR